jgi:hypothetical protein
MLIRFAIVVTIIELALTAAASVLVTYTEAPPAFATENDLRGLGFTFEDHSNRRWLHMNSPRYDTTAALLPPPGSLFVSLRTDASQTDLDFRRSRDEVIHDHPERGEVVLINEPLPGELGYAVRHRSPKSVRFELVRLRNTDLFIVRVSRDLLPDALPGAELSRCERQARAVQELLMFKMRWRD